MLESRVPLKGLNAARPAAGGTLPCGTDAASSRLRSVGLRCLPGISVVGLNGVFNSNVIDV